MLVESHRQLLRQRRLRAGLKHEWTKHKSFADPDAARLKVFKYVEAYCNPMLLHKRNNLNVDDTMPWVRRIAGWPAPADPQVSAKPAHHSSQCKHPASRPIQSRSHMREYFTYRSMRGAAGNGGSYRDRRLQRANMADNMDITLSS